MKRWDKRFLATTRGQVIALLRRGEATVNELADALELTDNAIRAHLATLERDGLVQQSGKRAGVRKPEILYAVTPEAEQLFPKAYHVVLNELLTILDKRLTPDEVEDLLRNTGRNLAAERFLAPNGNELRERVEYAVQILEEMGGLAVLVETADGFKIQGASCPLAESIQEHPNVCRLAESLLSAITGVPVHEQCERNGRPTCVFEIG